MKISQYSRLSHHTIFGATSGATFSVPASEDFTDGTWTPFDLALSEIGVNQDNENVFIRIGSDIKQFAFVGMTSGGGGTVSYTTPPLATVLAAGNTTGTNDIIVTSNQVIHSNNGGGTLALDYLGDGDTVNIRANDMSIDRHDSLQIDPRNNIDGTYLRASKIISGSSPYTRQSEFKADVRQLDMYFDASKYETGHNNTLDLDYDQLSLYPNAVLDAHSWSYDSSINSIRTAYTKQTTDERVVDAGQIIQLVPSSAMKVFYVMANVTGLATGSIGYFGRLTSSFVYQSGAIVQIGSTYKLEQSSFTGSVTSDIYTDGANIKLSVRGQATTGIDWNLLAEYN